jgi:hypothetical protein
MEQIYEFSTPKIFGATYKLSTLDHICFPAELQKAQNHLSLLRQEYVKLQNKYVELEQKYNLLVVQTGRGEFEKDSFVARLLNSVAELYDKELYRYVLKAPL